MHAAVATTSAYRANARRIRARLAHRPAAMHRALRSLNEGRPAPVRVATRPSPAGEAIALLAPDAAALFLQLVLDHLDGPLLRYSVRARLLRQADRLGIGRFEANLIIATAQHRRRAIVPAGELPHRPRPVLAAMVALLLQGAIVAFAWNLLAG